MRIYLTAVAVLVVLATSGLVAEQANLPGPAPSPLTTQAISPAKLDSSVQQEEKMSAYNSASRVANRMLLANGCSGQYSEYIGRAAVDNGLSARLLAAVVIVESSCRADAVSSEGAIGLVQVSPRTWHFSRRILKDPYMNLQIGGRILRRYVRRYGLRGGLHAYNGWGDPSDSYATKVLTVIESS